MSADGLISLLNRQIKSGFYSFAFMNIVVDAGNTLTKVGIFEKDSIRQKEVFDSLEGLKIFLQHFSGEHLIVSSVSGNQEQISSWSHVNEKKIMLTPTLPVPLENRYATPNTLGLDRLAAACGAWLIFPGKHALVIDAGTCINYEFVHQQGVYEGGAISPGIRMRFDAMHHFTNQLPAVAPDKNTPLTGSDTTTCLQSGVMNGALEEIRGVTARYMDIYPDIRVILTGGDAHFFENHLKPSIFVAPDLVLMGLNSILLHNVTS